MSNRLRAVLFDMDGVLYDSMPNHAKAWTTAVREHGLYMTPEEVYMNEGRTGAGTINALALRIWGREASEEECQGIYKTKSEVFNTLPLAVEMPGAKEVLDKVTSNGMKRILVTGSGQASLLDRLNRSYPGAFCKELMVTAFDVKFGKPNPEPYLMGLKKGGLHANEAIVVENAPLGVQAAHAAGIFTIAVNTGPLPDSTLLDAGADIVLSRGMKELAERWEEIQDLFENRNELA